MHRANIRTLRITLLAGLMLVILSGTALTVFFLAGRSGVSRQEDSFFRVMREYDAAAGALSAHSDFEHLGRELDRLERRTVTVESWLSVLKRRRAIANIHPPSMANYRSSAVNALAAYPHSQSIIAVAAAALVKDSPINMEAEERLRMWLPDITDSRFNALVLAFHVILGDFRNPQRAVALPENLLSDGSEIFNLNFAILKVIRGDNSGAAAVIQTLLNFPSDNILRFAGEYNYDFGDLLRSAEFFSLINDEAAALRQADALYLAGSTDHALSIWNTTAAGDNPNEMGLYNSAVLSKDSLETLAFLERLVNLNSDSKAAQFGLIRYSRLLESVQAVSLLSNSDNFSPFDYPYIDMEIAKRKSQEQNLGRQIAQTWLLLDRHEGNEELYKWAAWHFFFQRQSAEAQILLDRFEPQSADWADVYRAMLLMQKGDIDAAEAILLSLSNEEAPWYVFANLGRILETVRAPARALAQYELAAEKAQNPKVKAQIQIRMARNLGVLNRPGDARRALLFALEYDPENLTARLELDRTF